jgi:hypothetical protein
MATVTQRLFGRTVVDSLKLSESAWWIGDTQITVTGTQLNQLATTKFVTASTLGADVAGDGLGGGNGSALTLDLNELTSATISNSADSVPFIDATGNVSRKDTIVSLVSNMAGVGLSAATGILSVKVPANLAKGSLLFGATGDCTSVTIGGVVYAYAASPTVTNGEWAYGASASESATNLAAGIMGDTRNGGGKSFWAIADGDTVFVYALTGGIPPTATITRTGGAQPATLEALVGAAEATKNCTNFKYTVTANDVDTSVKFGIPLPFAPAFFTVQVRDTSGNIKYITDTVTVGTLPNRLIFTAAGAVHCAATDIISVYAQE